MGVACDTKLGLVSTSLLLKSFLLPNDGRAGDPPLFGGITLAFSSISAVTPPIYLLLILFHAQSLHLLLELHHHTEQITHLLTPHTNGIPAAIHQQQQTQALLTARDSNYQFLGEHTV